MEWDNETVVDDAPWFDKSVAYENTLLSCVSSPHRCVSMAEIEDLSDANALESCVGTFASRICT